MQKSMKFSIFLRTGLILSPRTGPWSQDQDRSDRSRSKTVTALLNIIKLSQNKVKSFLFPRLTKNSDC